MFNVVAHLNKLCHNDNNRNCSTSHCNDDDDFNEDDSFNHCLSKIFSLKTINATSTTELDLNKPFYEMFTFRNVIQRLKIGRIN